MNLSENEIVIRPATNADRAGVQRLVFGVLREFGLEPDPEGTDADLADIEKNYIESGGSFEVLLNGEGRLVGTVGLFPLDETTVELRKMYFAPSMRGRGWGKRLLERMIERARALGFKRIYLETASVLKQAVRLYEQYGFQPTTEGIHSERCDAAYYLDL
jgi:N-acetylglutamate synthase and related acetyltransferases